MDVFWWVIVPYLCLVTFALGHVWRYRYDKFGWTTRSSQLYETRLLRWGSPLFHFGILGVVIGHIGGLLIPKSWTDAIGISETMYHWAAVIGGMAAGIDRLVMLVCGAINLREITLFPMNQRAEDLLMSAPSEASPKQLREAHIRVIAPEK